MPGLKHGPSVLHTDILMIKSHVTQFGIYHYYMLARLQMRHEMEYFPCATDMGQTGNSQHRLNILIK